MGAVINAGMMSSNHDDWETPPELFAEWDARYHFDVDVCATLGNAKCAEYFTPEQDGLKQEWNGNKIYWCNPPYGRQIGKWIRKAYESAQNGATVVCLIPARTDTAWFRLCWQAKAMVFLNRRLLFTRNGEPSFNAKGRKTEAFFPSVIVVFNREYKDLSEFSNLGNVVYPGIAPPAPTGAGVAESEGE